MKRHYQTHHLNPFPHACQQCDQKFRRKLQLKKHEIKEHTGAFPHTCSVCQKSFLNSLTFKRHLNVHKTENKLKECEDCHLKFPNWSQLVEHRRKTHRKDQRLLCDLCDKSFCRKPNIRQHMQLHLASSSEVFQCHYENCPSFYSAKRNLMSHIRAKHEGRRWACDLCERELSSLQKLQQHIQSHLDPDRSKLLLKKKSTLSRLVGLDLPQKVEHLIINNGKVEISALVNRESKDNWCDF